MRLCGVLSNLNEDEVIHYSSPKGKEPRRSWEAYEAKGGGGGDFTGEDLGERWRTRGAERTAESEECSAGSCG